MLGNAEHKLPDGGIIGVPSTPAHLSVSELHQFLPQFRPDLDVQVGDWVIVTPVRRGPLLNPLIAAWEVPGASCCVAATTSTTAAIPARAPLDRFAVVVTGGVADDAVEAIEVAPLSRAKYHFTRRKRARRGSEHALAHTKTGGGDAEKPTVLYLHVRLGLLTATPPTVFGGRPDTFRALVRITRKTRADVTEELVPLQFRSESAISLPSPAWLSTVEAEAANDWRGSRLETTFSLPFPASQAKTKPGIGGALLL